MKEEEGGFANKCWGNDILKLGGLGHLSRVDDEDQGLERAAMLAKELVRRWCTTTWEGYLHSTLHLKSVGRVPVTRGYLSARRNKWIGKVHGEVP